MAEELRKISPEELKEILAEHKKWLQSGSKKGKRAICTKADLSYADLSYANLSNAYLSNANLSNANLSNANLSNANLTNANLSEARLNEAKLIKARLSWADIVEADLSGGNLRGADLDGADLRGVNIRGANLRGAELRGANLCGAELRGAILNEVNLSWGDLSGADLSGVDLSETRLFLTRIREEDLSGVKYRPEQLKDMIIERPEKEPLIVPEQKGRLIIRLTGENIPLMHLIYLSVFIEYQYDILYILLFNQYESLDELQQILSGSPFHKLQGKDEAVKIKQISSGSLLTELAGLLPDWVVLVSFTGYLGHQIYKRTDLLQRLVTWVFKSRKEELEEEKLEAEIERIRAETRAIDQKLFENIRKVDETQIDHLPLGEEEPQLLPTSTDQNLKGLHQQLEHHKNNLSTRKPREDCLESVLYLKQEGLITNKLTPQENANLFELHEENVQREFESLRKQLGDFEIDLEKEDEKYKK